MQPALFVIAVVSAVVFAITAEGSPRTLAWAGAGGLTITLAASVLVLVPLQRGIIAAVAAQNSTVEAMRARWFRGHLGRSVLSVASYVSLTLAVAV